MILPLTVGANDFVTRATALMAGAGGQVAKDGDFDSWNRWSDIHIYIYIYI